jgi:predicted acyltransferase
MTSPTAGAGRLVSLDAFRGATIAFMILVNTPGDGEHVYAPLQHAQWHGWTPTDVVFPSFLWIAGLAMTLSFTRRLEQGTSRWTLFIQMLRRAAILYGLGLVIYGFPYYDLGTLRLMGVLQRIAICTVAASAIWLSSGTRGRIAWLVALLAGYWALMMLVPVPGYGAGRLDVEGNLAHYVDRLVLARHNYQHTGTWDPEGIVSTLPAIATMLFGMFAGSLMLMRRTLSTRLMWMAAAGVALIVLGLICNQWLPINKKLWTTSFAIFMAGLDAVILAAFAWLVDVAGVKRPVMPLVVFGMNAIAVYMAAEMIDSVVRFLDVQERVYYNVFAPIASPINASLLYAVAYTCLMFLFAWALYSRRIFIKV